MEKIQEKKELLNGLRAKLSTQKQDLEKKKWQNALKEKVLMVGVIGGTLVTKLGTHVELSKNDRYEMQDAIAHGMEAAIEKSYPGLNLNVGNAANGFDFRQALSGLYDNVVSNSHFQQLSPEQLETSTRFINAYPQYAEYVNQVWTNIVLQSIRNPITEALSTGAAGAVLAVGGIIAINFYLNHHRQEEDIKRTENAIKNLEDKTIDELEK